MKYIPLFEPFKDMKEGFDKMLEIAEKIDNDDRKTEMIVCYGCLIETFNNFNKAKEEVSEAIN